MGHWRKQQHLDRYFKKAKQDGYRARSAYKLTQMQERFHLIHRGDVVVDLGAAPGSWSQVAVELVGPDGQVVALDLQAIDPIRGVTRIEGDMLDPEVRSRVVEAVGHRADVVLSDAAPATTGIKLRDHVRSIELARTAFELAQTLLRDGGSMVLKVFEGEDFPGLLQDVKRTFRRAQGHKPSATRDESWEMFIVARGYRG
jgi:23S rRNA (uridine2552-2'-O)-methyltransferase